MIAVEEIEARLAPLDDPTREAGSSAYTELWFDPRGPLPDDRPTLVFQHIRKTAGSSFRKVLQRSLKKHPAVRVPSLRHGAFAEGSERTRASLIDWHCDLFERLTPGERASLVCAASHEANFLLPLLGRPALALALVRDPVERVLSRYYFANRPPSGANQGKRARGVGPGIGAELRDWSLPELFERVGGRGAREVDRAFAFAQFFNGQARSILEPHFDTLELGFGDGPSDDADLWRARLREVVERDYLLGASDRFDEYVAAVAERAGWKRAEAPRAKVNPERPSPEQLPDDLRATIARHNWLDAELYGWALERAAERSRARRAAGPGRLRRWRSKAYQRAVKSDAPGSMFEIYFAPERLASDQPTLVFQHIEKTAGTSIRDVIHSNYSPRARHVLAYVPKGADRAAWYREFHDSLGEAERASIVCLVGHHVNHLMHLLEPERPCRPLTMLRDPVDRVLSRFAFGGRKRDELGRPGELERFFADAETAAGAKPKHSMHFYNGQSRALLEPLYDVTDPAVAASIGRPPDADVWLGRLDEVLDRYLVGFQDRFDASLELFARELGWSEVYAARNKVNEARPSAVEIDPGLRERIMAFNWLDGELYERASNRRAAPAATSPRPGQAGALPSGRNKAYLSAVKTGVPGATFEVYFASEPLRPDEPTVFFQHIEKTAGTSIRDVIHRNWASGYRHVVLDVPKEVDRAQWCADYHASLGEDERNSVKCIVAHAANHLAYRLDRPLRPLTMLREPVDRVLSRYHFGGKKRGGRRDWSLEDLFASAEAAAAVDALTSRQYFNGQARSLLEPFFDVDVPSLAASDGPPENADEWRVRLFGLLERDGYLVGVQDRFEEAVLAFASALGWGVPAAPRNKENRQRPSAATEDHLRRRIRAFNWLDVELYERFAPRASAEASPKSPALGQY